MRAPRPAAALALALCGPLALAAPAPAAAQDRPSEEELFGAPTGEPPASPAIEAPRPAPPPSGDERADELLGDPGRAAPRGVVSGQADDPLSVGGLLYLRTALGALEDTPPKDWVLTAPLLADVFLDVRPNDRVRGFGLGRLTFDATRPTEATGPLGATVRRGQARAVFDQLWIAFDVDRTVFVTAGKQHVKWGTGRFWNPTDYLHPVRRDPLDQFDDRTGVTMVKAHLPWEARGWNLYAMAVFEDLAGDTVNSPDDEARLGTVGKLGGAARAEVVLGPAELAADAALQLGHRPRLGLDGSFPLWDLDVRFELAFRYGKDAPRWAEVPGVPPSEPVLDRYVRDDPDHVTPAAVVGAEWTWKYSDEDTLTVGGEYYFDADGYTDPGIYPFLLAAPTLTGDPRPAYTPFYLAQQYAAAYLLLPAPGRWNDSTFTLSLVASLVDASGILRLDHLQVFNTWLRVETYVAIHGGKRGGEFRFGADVPPQNLGGGAFSPPISVPAPIAEAGVALRVNL